MASAGVGISSVEVSFGDSDEDEAPGTDTGSCGVSASTLDSCGTLLTAAPVDALLAVGPLAARDGVVAEGDPVVEVGVGAGFGSRADGVLVMVGSAGVVACPVEVAPVVPPAGRLLLPVDVDAVVPPVASGLCDGAASAVDALFADDVVAGLGATAAVPSEPDGRDGDGFAGRDVSELRAPAAFFAAAEVLWLVAGVVLAVP